MINLIPSLLNIAHHTTGVVYACTDHLNFKDGDVEGRDSTGVSCNTVIVLESEAGINPFQGNNACWVFWYDIALHQK